MTENQLNIGNAKKIYKIEDWWKSWDVAYLFFVYRFPHWSETLKKSKLMINDEDSAATFKITELHRNPEVFRLLSNTSQK